MANASAAGDDWIGILDDQAPAILLKSIDRWRREIIVTRERWMRHVVARHPELALQLWSLDAVLTDPDLVMHDTNFTDREGFYRSGLLSPPLDHLYLKVVVEFRHTGVGEVITAYPIAEVKPGEVQKWP